MSAGRSLSILADYWPAMLMDSIACGCRPVSIVAREGMHHEPRYAA